MKEQTDKPACPQVKRVFVMVDFPIGVWIEFTLDIEFEVNKGLAIASYDRMTSEGESPEADSPTLSDTD